MRMTHDKETMPTALILLANGFEDVEAVMAIDILRRAEIDLTVAGLSESLVKGARATQIQPETTLATVFDRSFDALILPGGMAGARNLAGSELVRDMVLSMHQQKKIVAAICAAPALVLAPTGILKGKKATCFPNMKDHFDDAVVYQTDPVVVDETIITSRALGTALPFSLMIVEKLCGKEVSQKIEKTLWVA